jgi:tetratricopeptide (TPR) repeat protein
MTKHRVTLLAILAALSCFAILGGCRSAHTTSAILYIEQEQYQKAIDVIDEGLTYNPNDPEGYYYQGEAYSRMAQQAIDENDYLLAKESFEEAYRKYTTARDMDPDYWSEEVAEALKINYQNQLSVGRSMWRDQNYEQAEGYFRLAYAALPDSLAAIQDIAKMKIQQAEGVSDKPDSASALREEALALLDQVLAERPEAYQLLSDKGYVLTQLDRTDEAQAIYDQLLREHGDDPILLLDVVGLYSKQERYEEAGELFMQVADIYLNDTDSENDKELEGLYREAGFNFQSAKNYPRALEALSLASEQNVENTQILKQRLQLHLQYGQELITQAAEAAQTDMRRAEELEVQYREVLQQGVNVGNALVLMAPDDPDAFYYLATCQAALGDLDASQQNMKTYQELSGSQ